MERERERDNDEFTYLKVQLPKHVLGENAFNFTNPQSITIT